MVGDPEIGGRWHLGAGAESLELLSVNPLPSSKRAMKAMIRTPGSDLRTDYGQGRKTFASH
jgi:hypothetical protein